MHTYRVETILTEDSTLTLVDLPFHAGETVQVVIVTHGANLAPANRYPLRGAPVEYTEPTEPVAEADWESAR